jgi:hypothetical protein
VGIAGLVVATIMYFVGGLALMSWSESKVIAGFEQARICERAGAMIAEIDAEGIDDVPDSPGDLVPTELAEAFPGTELLQARVLLSSADVVRETIPEAGAWYVELDRQDFTIGWVQALSFRGLELSVKLEQFGSHRQAVAYSTWLALEVNCRYSNEVFAGRVPGSLGFQIRFRSGSITEQLTFVRGSNRYTVAVNRPDAPADHSLVDRLAEEIAQVDPR